MRSSLIRGVQRRLIPDERRSQELCWCSLDPWSLTLHFNPQWRLYVPYTLTMKSLRYAKGCLKWNCVNSRMNGDYFSTELITGLPNAACPCFWRGGTAITWSLLDEIRVSEILTSWSFVVMFPYYLKLRSYHGSSEFSPASQPGDRVQFEAIPCGMYGGKSDDLWWKKWQWNRLFS